MPNWCSNTLIVSCKKKHRDELKTFIKTASNKGIIKKKDLEKERESWLGVHRPQYDKQLDLKGWVEHNTMPVDEFFVKILGCEKQKNGDIIKGDSDLSMQNILPCPEELRRATSPVRAENGETEKEFKERVKRCVEQYGHADWYNWSIANYGTKWDINAEINNQDEDSISYYFDSAWSPPTAFVQFVSEKFPNLKFVLEYDEPGMCFRGTATCENGDLDDQCEENYTPVCNECEEEYDDNGDCGCTREDEREQEKAAEKQDEKKTSKQKKKK